MEFSVKLYRGDARTLIAFNLPKGQTKDLAGFTIQYITPSGQSYYLWNNLQFEHPGLHAQDPSEPPYSSVNAPIHMFRWVHFPGSFHQGLQPEWGTYTYTVTPRYFRNGLLQKLDPALSKSQTIDVAPFKVGSLTLGFTRGYTQSQAFVHHFGKNALIRPKNNQLIFDTKKISGSNNGQQYTYAQEYEWLGFTARERIFAMLNEVQNDASLHVDVFAYDLSEPDLIQVLLQLAQQGRIRIILDNAALHTTSTDKKTGKIKISAEDEFEKLFKKHGHDIIKRGKFGRYSHDKVFIISKKGSNPTRALKVLTGSTNFSVTGLYVNSNHVLVFDDNVIAAKYQEVFDAAWKGDVKLSKFTASDLDVPTGFDFATAAGNVHITFSPHEKSDAKVVLGEVVARIQKEAAKPKGSVLFAVMVLDGSKPKKKNVSSAKQKKSASNMVYKELEALHKQQGFFSYGISDSNAGLSLYRPGNRGGVLVTGKPNAKNLPAPFDQVPGVGLGHQVHHKFVVCGFNGDDPVVFCGSSNLAEGGEAANGDNLLAIHSPEVATAFAIEALSLVDHFNFLDNFESKSQDTKSKSQIAAKSKVKKMPVSKVDAAKQAAWYLDTNDKWVQKFYDPQDSKNRDRQFFA
jgi:phosphatidylserine/phosphatidylglycerophosphate/cardiolipin synthase-like enzyme